ncbi:MAG: glycosyltransferase family 4 protein [Lentisphaerae bacterium]|nr:glycosyltransferase family 4 protein [Lentisphaerota bacterium]
MRDKTRELLYSIFTVVAYMVALALPFVAYFILEEHHFASNPVDLRLVPDSWSPTKPAIIEFTHDFNHAHSMALFISLPQKLDFSKSHRRATGQIGTEFGWISLSKSEKPDQKLLDNHPLNIVYSLQLAENNQFVPIAKLPHDLKQGGYTLEVTPTQALLDSLGPRGQAILRVAYQSCPLDFAYTAVNILGFAIIMAIFIAAGSFAERKRRRIIRYRSRKLYARLLNTAPQTSIAFLYAQYPKWSETFLRQDLTLLQQQNLNVKPISIFQGDCEPEAHWPKAEYLNATSNSNQNVATASTIRQLIFLPKQINLAISIWKHRKNIEKLRQQLTQARATHVHAEFADLPALLAKLAADKLGISYSVGIHAFDIHAAKYPPKWIFQKAAFITACNNAAADALVQTLPSVKDKIRRINHGIDLELWTYGEPHEPNPSHRIIFVGRLVPKKGVHLLLRALRLLLDRERQVSLTIVGTGPLELELKALAHRLNLAPHIAWMGRQAPEDVHRLLRNSTCFCAPAIVAPDGDQDGIPNTILEAMAAGIPVIATKAGSIQEAVNEKTGWVIDIPSPKDIAKTIDIFIDSKHDWNRRRQNARSLVEKNFNARKLAKDRAEIFRNQS